MDSHGVSYNMPITGAPTWVPDGNDSTHINIKLIY